MWVTEARMRLTYLNGTERFGLSILSGADFNPSVSVEVAEKPRSEPNPSSSWARGNSTANGRQSRVWVTITIFQIETSFRVGFAAAHCTSAEEAWPMPSGVCTDYQHRERRHRKVTRHKGRPAPSRRTALPQSCTRPRGTSRRVRSTMDASDRYIKTPIVPSDGKNIAKSHFPGRQSTIDGIGGWCYGSARHRRPASQGASSLKSEGSADSLS